MPSRLIASVTLGVAVILGTAGCSLVAPQSTLIQYSASDGVNVFDSKPLQVRNAMIIANDEGTAGNLIAAIVNPTDKVYFLNIQVGTGPSAINQSIRVAANSTVSLGTDGTAPLLLAGIGTKPGATLSMYFQSGDQPGAVAAVPVLDGKLPYYAPFVPGTSDDSNR